MAVTRWALRPYLAEFLGTCLLVTIGDGVVAQCLLSDYTYGTWLSINVAWACAVVLTTHLSDPSPACNPAISVAAALVRPSPRARRQLPARLAAQFLGAFAGAALVYAEYYSAIARWDPEYTIPGGSILSPQGHHSAGIFATYPSADFASNWEAVLQEGLGAAVLMFGLLAIGDDGDDNDDDNSNMDAVGRPRPRPRRRRSAPPQLSLFALLVAIGAACGWQTGYAVNPARDFGPRLFSALVYGREVFTAKGYYFVVPLLAPVAGCLVGAVTYDAMLYDGRGSAVADSLDWLGSRGAGSVRLEGDDEGVVRGPGAWRD